MLSKVCGTWVTCKCTCIAFSLFGSSFCLNFFPRLNRDERLIFDPFSVSRESAATLEAESGYQMESQQVTDFRQCIFEARWDNAIEVLSRLGSIDEENLRVRTFLHPSFSEARENRRYSSAPSFSCLLRCFALSIFLSPCVPHTHIHSSRNSSYTVKST